MQQTSVSHHTTVFTEQKQWIGQEVTDDLCDQTVFRKTNIKKLVPVVFILMESCCLMFFAVESMDSNPAQSSTGHLSCREEFKPQDADHGLQSWKGRQVRLLTSAASTEKYRLGKHLPTLFFAGMIYHTVWSGICASVGNSSPWNFSAAALWTWMERKSTLSSRE